MKLNKMNRKEIDYLIKIDIESHWSNKAACNPNLAEMEFKFVADEIIRNHPEIKYKDIFIDYHYDAAEYCIYVKGKWSGYVEQYYSEGYLSFDDYYRFENFKYYPVQVSNY